MVEILIISQLSADCICRANGLISHILCWYHRFGMCYMYWNFYRTACTTNWLPSYNDDWNRKSLTNAFKEGNKVVTNEVLKTGILYIYFFLKIIFIFRFWLHLD
jgi:hypothetical protein